MKAPDRERPRASAVLLALALGVGVLFLGARSYRGVAPERVPRTPELAGLRIFAEAGDYRLQNASVMAVVRRRDGALIDFSRRGAVLPSTDQLGLTTAIDGLWDLTPVAVSAQGKPTLPGSATVEALADAVEARSLLFRNGQVIAATLRYELDAERPLLRIHASFHAEPQLAPGTDVGLMVRWGNVAYFVSDSRQPLLAFAGRVRWAGRSGAGGDLLLRASSPSTFLARFESRKPGFQGGLHALAARPTAAHRKVEVSWELAYEPLPLPQAPPEAPPARLELTITDEEGLPLASKLTLLREGKAERIFPDDGGIEGAHHFAWTGNGKLVCQPPAGKYDLVLSAGPERELWRTSLRLTAAETRKLEAVLPRVLTTPGWLSADLHLHQAPSVDADISLAARLVAVAAEGVELAVATDHFVVTDLGPSMEALLQTGVLARRLLTLPGIEVSTVGNRFGHFNVFPLRLDAQIEYRNTTPTRLFENARAVSPAGFLQVNHPRWEAALGYFTRFGLSPDDARITEPGFDAGFDGVEVYNGDDAADLSKVERVLVDYIHLLGSGRRYVATGSSDSHKLAFLDPGLPRTYIASGAESDEADARAPLTQSLPALKAGRALVSSGPFVEVSVAGQGPGQSARGAGGLAQVRIRVRAAPWVSTRRLRVLEGPLARVAAEIELPSTRAVLRFERTLAIEAQRPTFIVVSVTGDEPLPNTAEPVVPFAFTNPVWLEP